MDETMLARILALNVEALALDAEVKGMVAENLIRVHRGETLAYDEAVFVKKAYEMRAISSGLNQFGSVRI